MNTADQPGVDGSGHCWGYVCVACLGVASGRKQMGVAARLAGKDAVTSISRSVRIRWMDMDILRRGKPTVRLNGKTRSDTAQCSASPRSGHHRHTDASACVKRWQ